MGWIRIKTNKIDDFGIAIRYLHNPIYIGIKKDDIEIRYESTGGRIDYFSFNKGELLSYELIIDDTIANNMIYSDIMNDKGDYVNFVEEIKENKDYNIIDEETDEKNNLNNMVNLNEKPNNIIPKNDLINEYLSSVNFGAISGHIAKLTISSYKMSPQEIREYYIKILNGATAKELRSVYSKYYGDKGAFTSLCRAIGRVLNNYNKWLSERTIR